MDIIGYTCAKCKKTITQEDLKAHKGGAVGDKVYCQEHLQEIMSISAMKTAMLDNEGKEIKPEDIQ